jgi:hypothetical protein
MADLKRVSVMESRNAPGVFLAMAWAASSADLAGVLREWAAGQSAGKVICSAGSEARVAALRRELSDWTWSVAENVTADDRIAVLREVFVAEGWLLSLDGAAAWVAAQKGSGVRLGIDFSPPTLPLRLPAGTRVGGIIIPQ